MGIKIWIFNLVLAAGAVFLGLRSYEAWSSKETGDASVPGPAVRSPAFQPRRAAVREMPPEKEFEVLAEKNLFSPERKEPESADEPVNEDAGDGLQEIQDLKAAGKKIFLYGVVIADDYRAALITNPDWQTDKQPQSWVRLGDTVEGLKVAVIEQERVLLASEGKEYEMLLFDKEKPRTQVAAAAPSTKKPDAAAKGKEKTAVAPLGKEPKGISPIPPSTDRDPRRRSAQESAKSRKTVAKPQGYGKFHGQLK